MAKRTTFRASKKLTLHVAPTLLTDIRSAEWSGGVLMVDAKCGPDSVALALGPNAALQLLQAINFAAKDTAAPFNRQRSDPAPTPAEKARP